MHNESNLLAAGRGEYFGSPLSVDLRNQVAVNAISSDIDVYTLWLASLLNCVYLAIVAVAKCSVLSG